MRFGKFENNQRSRFLREIDPECIASRSPLGPSQPFSLFGEVRKKPSRPSSYTPPSSPAAATSIRNLLPLGERKERSAAPMAESTAGLSLGSHIIHSRFGRGTVVAIEGTGLDCKATVEFENAGRKQLLLRFAKFEVVG